MRDKKAEEFVLFHELRDWGITFSRTHINRLIAAGVFPVPVQLNRLVGKHGSTKAWRSDDLRVYCERVVAARNSEAA